MNESTLVPREEMSDLDWLARNVHAWSACATHVKQTLQGRIWANEPGLEEKSGWHTKQQWLARRAELQNKPSFSDHPDAKCFAQTVDGFWVYGFNAEKLTPSYGLWEVNSFTGIEGVKLVMDGSLPRKGDVLGDWRDTLEKRPADLSEQAVTARLKEAAENVLAAAPELMTEKYKFEPFVSVEDAATAKQPAPKGSGNPILGMVLADLTNRALEGKEKYGEPLLAHNGRNPLWDAYQEALDLAMYLRQAIEEQK